MPLPVSTWIDEGIGLDINCQGCGRWSYLPPEEARRRDLGHLTFKMAAFRFLCEVCGAKGGPVIAVRFSIGDYYDIIDEKRGRHS